MSFHRPRRRRTTWSGRALGSRPSVSWASHHWPPTVSTCVAHRGHELAVEHQVGGLEWRVPRRGRQAMAPPGWCGRWSRSRCASGWTAGPCPGARCAHGDLVAVEAQGVLVNRAGRAVGGRVARAQAAAVVVPGAALFHVEPEVCWRLGERQARTIVLAAFGGRGLRAEAGWAAPGASTSEASRR